MTENHSINLDPKKTVAKMQVTMDWKKATVRTSKPVVSKPITEVHQ